MNAFWISECKLSKESWVSEVFYDHHKKVLCRFDQHSKNEKEVQWQLDDGPG